MRWVWAGLVAGCAGDVATGDTGKGDDLDGDHYHGANDCDDSDPDIHPGATDPPYDGIDSDCAGDSDEDADHDGFDRGVDCDDTDPTVNPDGVEVCNGADDDCEGTTDGPDAADVSTYYVDLDDDDYGDTAAGPRYACTLPLDGALADGDCDDADPDVHPANPEDCDGKDNDCDDVVDEDLPTVAIWPDVDLDGYGDLGAAPTYACAGPGPAEADNALDCDDADPATYDGAPDVACDGVDNDCDGIADEAGVVDVDGVPQPDLATALAVAGAGAVVSLCEGRYPAVGLVVGAPVTLAGAGSATTVLDGLGVGAALEVTASGATLSGVSLTGGHGRAEGGGLTRGGGLYVHPGVALLALDVVVDGNTAGEGGGVWVGDGASLTWIGGSASDNVADDALADVFSVGGGVYAADGAELLLGEVEVSRNTAARCGGVRIGELGVLDGAGTAGVRDNTDGGLGGGGVCADGSGGLISAIEVTGNAASNAGGGVIGSDLVLVDVWLDQNTSALTGGGLHASGLGPVSLVDCDLTSNTAGIDGGGLFVAGDLVTLQGGTVVGNGETFFASFGGGAGVAAEGVLESVDASWVGNTDADVGIDAYAASFGGVASFTCSGELLVCE